LNYSKNIKKGVIFKNHTFFITHKLRFLDFSIKNIKKNFTFQQKHNIFEKQNQQNCNLTTKYKCRT